MPEGDVLRWTANRLGAALTGLELTRAELRWPSAAGVDLVGRRVTGCEPYGKHLFLRFDDDRSLHTHLRMDGSWLLRATPARGTSHPAVRAVLVTDRWTAIGDRLGMLDVVATRDEHTLVAHLGPDVLAPDFPGEGLPRVLRAYARQGRRPVAEVLLDQRVQAGIGTIYLAESLFLRGVWPWTPAAEVDDPASLLMTARTLMERSVAASLRAQRWVHGRHRSSCRRCGTPIRVGSAGDPPVDRPVFYCPTCQAPVLTNPS